MTACVNLVVAKEQADASRHPNRKSMAGVRYRALEVSVMSFSIKRVILGTLVCIMSSTLSLTLADSPPTGKKINSSGFTLWQLPSQIGSIGMSYVIQTKGGKVIVVDGGFPKDAGYLRGFIAALGNTVDAWFISHPHDDHAGALCELLKAPRDLNIKVIYTSMNDYDWYTKVEPDSLAFFKEFFQVLHNSGVKVVDVQLGAVMDIDGAKCKVIGVKNPEITNNAYNESSMVVKISDSKKSVLFLGDLGVEGGKKLVAGKYAKDLPSDYVQMAHHGQNGVDENCYKAIKPKYCLWPTPLWVWTNYSGKGTLATLEVRKWIDELGVKQNYPSYKGLVKIDQDGRCGYVEPASLAYRTGILPHLNTHRLRPQKLQGTMMLPHLPK